VTCAHITLPGRASNRCRALRLGLAVGDWRQREVGGCNISHARRHACLSERGYSADTTGDNNWGLVQMRCRIRNTRHKRGEVVRLARRAMNKRMEQFSRKPLTCRGNQCSPASRSETLTTAYPILTVSGGKGAKIWLTYSEASTTSRCTRRPRRSGRSPATTERQLPARCGQHRTFEPLWWRTGVISRSILKPRVSR